MKLRTAIFTTMLTLSCALTATAQSSGVQCDIKPARAPELRGLRLEMTLSQLKARYPRLPLGAPDSLGQLRVNLSQNQLAEIDPAAFKGIQNLFIYLLDDRLVAFGVAYPTLPWKDVQQFVARMSEALKLPDAWRGDDAVQNLDCSGFQVSAGWSSFGSNGMATYINFKEQGADEVVRARIDKQKEEVLRSFKP